MEEVMDIGARRREYKSLIRDFRRLTAARWPNGRCCQEAPRGFPLCCVQVAEGAPLEFTDSEKLLINTPIYWFDGADLDRRNLTRLDILRSLQFGQLRDTLESASHPTRPVLDQEVRVVGVVAVPDCCTQLLVGKVDHDELVGLWQRAVDLVGSKAYYWQQREDLVAL